LGKNKKGKRTEGEDSWDVNDTPAPAGAALAARASEAILNLSQGIAMNLTSSTALEWTESMKRLVVGHSWEGENGAFVTNTLQSLASPYILLNAAAVVEFD
jgi:hypothetical protein